MRLADRDGGRMAWPGGVFVLFALNLGGTDLQRIVRGAMAEQRCPCGRLPTSPERFDAPQSATLKLL